MARRKGATCKISKVIILDTNILSEFMRQEPDATVTTWLDALPRQNIRITTISIFELRFGIELHATGRRRSQLEHSLDRILNAGFRDRILHFDEQAANAAALISAAQRAIGRSKEIRDTFIAGIAMSQNADLATRNVRHFGDMNIRVINPWAS
jgi:predicted nucleic acid-binding protein